VSIQIAIFYRKFPTLLIAPGYRLVYEVDDGEIVVFVIAVGKRENNAVYDVAMQRKS
jgi:mRNA interferase RelE/StbE